MIQKEYFKTLATKQLLSLRRDAWCDHPRFDGDIKKDVGYWCKGYEIDMDSLFEELSTRPHVASGMEAKLMRKLRAEHHMTEKEIREVPKYRKMLSDAQKEEEKSKNKKDAVIHPLVKNICIKLKLHPNHPKIKEEIIKLDESGECPFYYREDIKELRKGYYYIIKDGWDYCSHKLVKYPKVY